MHTNPNNSLGPDREALETTVPGEERPIPSAADDDSPALDRGSTLGRYTVLERIGAGGMGVVYAAFDPQLDRKIALKVMHPSLRGGSSGSDGRSRLLREAQAMAKLNHPNVITVHDVGTFGQRVFVAMEFIEGTTLREWGEQQLREWPDIVEEYVKAGRGLAAAHAAGLVHRDFKPDNVLKGKDGRVLVMDFGLARPTAGATEQAPSASADAHPIREVRDLVLTRTGALLGTPAYMAPEQHKGGKPDPHADQFSFCVALYEALYGERPFKGKSVTSLAMNVLDGHVSAAPKNSRVPGWLRDVVVRGLSTDPEDRYPSMDALLAELQRDPVEKRPPWVAIGAALGAATLIIGGYFATRPPIEDQCAAQAEVIDTLWNDDDADAATKALTSTGVAHADAVGQQIDRALSGWTNRWRDTYLDVCRANVRPAPRGPAPDEVPGLVCLQLLRQETAELADALSEADPLVVLYGPLALDALPNPQGCAGGGELSASDMDGSKEHAALRTGIAKARAHFLTGRPSVAVREAEGLVSGAAALDDPGLQARALQVRARSDRALGDLHQAEAELQTAVIHAGQADLPRLESEIWIELTDLVGHHRDRRAEGLRLALAAEAALARAGNPPDLVARLTFARGKIAAAAGRYDEAFDELRRSLQLTNAAGGAQSVSSSAVISALGLAEEGLGRFDDAMQTHARALELRERALGSQHPLVGQSLGYLGSAMLGADFPRKADASLVRARWVLDLPVDEGPWPPVDPDLPDGARVHTMVKLELAQIEDRAGLLARAGEEFAEAAESHERALALMKGALPEDDRARGYPLNNLGLAYADRGMHREALVPLRQAVEIWSAALPPSHPDLAAAHLNVANSLWAIHQYVEAKMEYERALDVWQRTLPEDHPLLAYALTGIGRCALAVEDYETAVDTLERALTIRDRESEDRLNLAETSLALGRALWVDLRDTTRARELAERARDLVGAYQPTDPAGIERLLDGEEVPRLTDQLVPAGLGTTNRNPSTLW